MKEMLLREHWMTMRPKFAVTLKGAEKHAAEEMDHLKKRLEKSRQHDYNAGAYIQAAAAGACLLTGAALGKLKGSPRFDVEEAYVLHLALRELDRMLQEQSPAEEEAPGDAVVASPEELCFLLQGHMATAVWEVMRRVYLPT